MAGSARYTAVLDACVLHPAPVRDLLLSLAAAGLYHARWTDQIQAEWIGSLLARRPDLDRHKLQRTADLMAEAVPDCLVKDYAWMIDALRLPDPDDRHVLAAAVAGHADAIVTFNLYDFPQAVLAPFEIEAQHPDDFVMNQFELHELIAIDAVRGMRQRLRNPPMSAALLTDTLERCGLPQSANYLRRLPISRLI